jgi:hypothetical protein
MIQMNENWLFMRSKHNCVLLSFLSFEKKKTGAIFLDANLIWVTSSAVIQAGLPVCIMVLLADVRTLKSDKGMHKRKEILGIRIPYLFCIPPWSHVVLLACWGYFVDEQRSHTPLKVVAHLPCCLATLDGHC